MAESNHTSSLSLQLRAASSLLDTRHPSTLDVEPEYIPQTNEHPFRITVVIDYSPGYFNAYKVIERFQMLMKRCCPLLHRTDFRFLASSSGSARYEIEFLSENPLTEGEERFLWDTRKPPLPEAVSRVVHF